VVKKKGLRVEMVEGFKKLKRLNGWKDGRILLILQTISI
jgi:hypothetical protein